MAIIRCGRPGTRSESVRARRAAHVAAPTCWTYEADVLRDLREPQHVFENKDLVPLAVTCPFASAPHTLHLWLIPCGESCALLIVDPRAICWARPPMLEGRCCVVVILIRPPTW